MPEKAKVSFLSRPRRRQYWRHIVASLLAILVYLISSPHRVAAHPLGNFSVNTYSRLELGAGEIRLLYIVDMAEIPAFQERARIDINADEIVQPSEEERYLAEEAARLREHLSLLINGRPAELRLTQKVLEFPPGQGGLDTQRMSLHLAATVARKTSPWQASYIDDNFVDRLGWREVIVVGPATPSRFWNQARRCRTLAWNCANTPRSCCKARRLLATPPSALPRLGAAKKRPPNRRQRCNPSWAVVLLR